MFIALDALNLIDENFEKKTPLAKVVSVLGRWECPIDVINAGSDVKLVKIGVWGVENAPPRCKRPKIGLVEDVGRWKRPPSCKTPQNCGHGGDVGRWKRPQAFVTPALLSILHFTLCATYKTPHGVGERPRFCCMHEWGFLNVLRAWYTW
ncbi:hypothetical protein PIB30_033351 [Stylosanthes scabra]|uniref:Uncharacterized protein n=1 Tax=Stylosanthes scabra TaxID=79078 RepID=A0ABU6WEK0_9FABA|nr:hypothetical protein [Stylosanthes scabra]